MPGLQIFKQYTIRLDFHDDHRFNVRYAIDEILIMRNEYGAQSAQFPFYNNTKYLAKHFNKLYGCHMAISCTICFFYVIFV
jgi:hypothetical protein